MSLTFKKHRAKKGKARYGGLDVPSFHGFDRSSSPGYAKKKRTAKKPKTIRAAL